ncbi:MAG: hypothetical protein AAF990_19025 [Bacteroidota bacterium]
MIQKTLILVLIFCAIGISVVGQSSDIPSISPVTESPEAQNGPPANADSSIPTIPTINSMWENDEIVKSLIIMVFSFIIFTMLLFRLKVPQMGPEDFIRLTILVLVICSSMYLISAGWDNQQTAPAFGILGTIAGYLLGRDSKKQAEETEETETDNP